MLNSRPFQEVPLGIHRQYTMKKRVRKKLRLGEFRELCFEISYEIVPGLSVEQCDGLNDDFIAMIEEHGLQFGGGGSRDGWNGIVELAGRGTAAEHHRRIVAAWLESQPQIKACTVGQLVDAWHGW